ncbi:hypothetical protein FB451DRAFT_1163830 [Mycena latifolia]|nr:hypothetical protein FB451DRAFT_1163830 [Mycena latifolia]
MNSFARTVIILSVVALAARPTVGAPTVPSGIHESGDIGTMVSIVPTPCAAHSGHGCGVPHVPHPSGTPGSHERALPNMPQPRASGVPQPNHTGTAEPHESGTTATHKSAEPHTTGTAQQHPSAKQPESHSTSTNAPHARYFRSSSANFIQLMTSTLDGVGWVKSAKANSEFYLSVYKVNRYKYTRDYLVESAFNEVQCSLR